MKLKKISVTSFKKIAELEIELHALNLVIGANNSGKSSLLQAIHTAVSAAQSQTEVGSTTFAEEILRYSPSSQFASLGHGSSFGNRKNQNRATIKFTADQTVDNINEEIEYTIEMYKGRNERNVGINRSGHQRLGNSISSIENPFSIYVPGLAGIPHFEEFRASPVVLRKLAGGEANLVLRNIIWQITKQEKLGELISNLNEFFPGIDIRTDYREDRDTNINIEVRASKNDSYYSIELCGTGILQAIQIFAYVTLFQPTLLLLDEPDAHLHPSNQIKLIEAISFLYILYGTKTIIATHSRHLMNAAQNDGRFFWLKDGGVKEDGTFELASVLMDIGGLDDADKLLNWHKEYLFFIEDKKKKSLKRILSSCGISENRYEAISYHGVSNADATARILGALRPYIQGDPKIIVHRDRDFMEDREISPFRTAFENNGFKVFVTEGSDLESYFINAEHIAEGTDHSAADISKVIDDCLLANESDIRKRFRDKRREINRMPINADGNSTPTDQLCPENVPIEIRHAVGKDFCRMFRKYSEEKLGHLLNPEKRSNVKIAPDLIALLD